MALAEVASKAKILGGKSMYGKQDRQGDMLRNSSINLLGLGISVFILVSNHESWDAKDAFGLWC